MNAHRSNSRDGGRGLLVLVSAAVLCLHGPAAHAAGGQSPWKFIPNTPEALGLASDPAGKSIWFTSRDRLGRIDAESEKVAFVADGAQHGGLSMHKLVLDG